MSRHQPSNGADSPAGLAAARQALVTEAMIDERRLNAMIAYCPLCRRPATREPIAALDALGRLARHLVDSHDVAFAPLLRIALDRELRAAIDPLDAPEPGADPFYPTADRW